MIGKTLGRHKAHLGKALANSIRTGLPRRRAMLKKISFLAVLAFLAACSLLVGALMAQTGFDPSTIEKSFLEWFKTAPKSDMLPFEAYRDKLRSDGMGEQEAEQVRVLLNKLRYTQPALAEVLFDYAYSRPVLGFNTKPNALLAETIRNLPPGKALDVCMGQGRNSIFLAQMGWQVTGFDISSEGLKAAQATAEKAGLQLRTIQSASESFDYGKDQWDLILLSYAFGPFQDPTYIAKIAASLRKGGILVWEHYSTDESTSLDGSPSKLNSLLNMFASFRILRYEYVMAQGDWSPQGPNRRIARLVAQKM
jgi:SAM-dependent methyltransferase